MKTKKFCVGLNFIFWLCELKNVFRFYELYEKFGIDRNFEVWGSPMQRSAWELKGKMGLLN